VAFIDEKSGELLGKKLISLAAAFLKKEKYPTAQTPTPFSNYVTAQINPLGDFLGTVLWSYYSNVAIRRINTKDGKIIDLKNTDIDNKDIIVDETLVDYQIGKKKYKIPPIKHCFLFQKYLFDNASSYGIKIIRGPFRNYNLAYNRKGRDIPWIKPPLIGPLIQTDVSIRSASEVIASIFTPIVSNIIPWIEDLENNLRYRVLLRAYDFLGLKEKPGNTGPEVLVFQKAVGSGKGAAWCNAFVSYVYQNVTKELPNGVRTPRCFTQRQAARKKGQFKPAMLGLKPGDPRAPMPGDFYTNSKIKNLDKNADGHTGFVVNLKTDTDGKIVAFTTISGNESDMVRENTYYIGKKKSGKWNVGFINPYPDEVKLSSLTSSG